MDDDWGYPHVRKPPSVFVEGSKLANIIQQITKLSGFQVTFDRGESPPGNDWLSHNISLYIYKYPIRKQFP